MATEGARALGSGSADQLHGPEQLPSLSWLQCPVFQMDMIMAPTSTGRRAKNNLCKSPVSSQVLHTSAPGLVEILRKAQRGASLSEMD